MTNPQVKVVLDTKSLIGEGPHYNCDNNELIWVDINGKSINFLNLADGTNKSFQFPGTLGAAIPSKSGKCVVAVIGRSICLVDRVTGMIKVL